jgi:tRNA (mo5U34)-methyltransferase
VPIHRFIDECFASTDSLAPFHHHLQQQIDEFFAERPHGRSNEWNDALLKLPNIDSVDFNLNANTVIVSADGALAPELADELPEILKTFKPWRKGPFQIGDQFIDTEWRSDWKWQRIQPHITSLAGRSVLDIGCGNGYHLLRMLGEGASMALGIDPTRLFLYQFHILRHFLPGVPAWLLPLRSEHLPAFSCFDTVFSLGVLYHRRSPIDHLTELHSFLAPGGELVLETLIIEGDEQTVLMPQDRYAKMANVWFLPSPAALENWLRRAGFVNVRTVDVNQTSVEEQRATEWMDFHSLAEFLDPNDSNLTAEGLPAPKRAIVIANKP